MISICSLAKSGSTIEIGSVWKARSQAAYQGYSHLSGMEMTSSFSIWNHSEFRAFRYPVWRGLEWCSSSQLSPSKKKNCLDQSMPATAWRITLATSSLADGGVTDL